MSKLTKAIQAMKQRSVSAIGKITGARDSAAADSIEPEKSQHKSHPVRFERGGSVPDIFPDGEVCRLLGKNRSYLIKTRKSRNKGADWDVIDHHAGMTASWILKERPDADLARILPWRIKPGDGIVSVQVLQHTMDFRKLACKRLSDGATIVVSVDDSARFADGDQFDVQELSGTYRWNESLNRIWR